MRTNIESVLLFISPVNSNVKIIGYISYMCHTFWHRFRYAVVKIYLLSNSVNSRNINNEHLHQHHTACTIMYVTCLLCIHLRVHKTVHRFLFSCNRIWWDIQTKATWDKKTLEYIHVGWYKINIQLKMYTFQYVLL